MTERDDLTSKQSDYAVFLPAISGFYATYIGKQRVANNYVDPARFPQGMTDMEQMNWLNSQQALFPYRWSLYSAGHANLDLNKPDASEDMVRAREAGTFMLGDSGGFQIAKGLWEGEWRDPNSAGVQQKMADMVALGKEVRTVMDKSGNPVINKKTGQPKTQVIDHAKNYQSLLDAAQKKRDTVLRWLDGISDYAMTLDIPTWVIHDKKAGLACGISTLKEAVEATKYNNEYFMQHRRGIEAGGTRVLNVLQGANHADAENWYQEMKQFCDPQVYPGKHFNGWAMGGQNMCDVHLVLKRLVALRHDNLLQEGVHDWMHFLGTSKLEWAILLTDLQRAVRKYVNPRFTISFDCASPFLATANGQVYFENTFEHDSKWSYRMAPSADDKRYATDTRPWAQGVVADGIYPIWQPSPISDLLTMKDICIYNPGDLNKVGKEGKTSWDSFSYALLMGHNVYLHITAVQEANRRYDAGDLPSMMWYRNGDHARFRDIVDAIFATTDRDESEAIIEHYSRYWMDIVGTRGFKGKKALNSLSQFNALFEMVEDQPVEDLDQSKLEELEHGLT
jgi:hypothetical protein